jgi:hypothetical protein
MADLTGYDPSVLIERAKETIEAATGEEAA